MGEKFMNLSNISMRLAWYWSRFGVQVNLKKNGDAFKNRFITSTVSSTISSTLTNIRGIILFYLIFLISGASSGHAAISPISNNHLYVHDYETTRLKSTAGTGVASVLLEEGTVLNPATMAYYNISSIYFQKYRSKYADNSSLEQSTTNRPVDKSDSLALILADTKSSIKGAVSFQKQREWQSERKRLGLATAFPIGKYSSIGMTFRYTKDINSDDGLNTSTEKYNQFIFGISHATEFGLSLGALVIDPLNKKSTDRKALIGAQYMVANILSLMFDVGSDYKENLSEKVLYRGAIQINLFSDLYLRTGVFRDRGAREKGNGVGLGWVSPRLMIEAALKNTEFLYELNAIRSNGIYWPNNMKELSFSLSLRF